jgi:hypothetical protein
VQLVHKTPLDGAPGALCAFKAGAYTRPLFGST